ncbi:hypothetical protein WL53_16260 [Burkholderia ubonensis]|nr:hypothetical protein WL53_16260 [Burkholderia ubonensis]
MCAAWEERARRATSAKQAAAALPQSVLDALRFYANGSHFNIDNDHQDFDTVSGEPVNWLYSTRDDDTTMIEDGSIAKAALCGKPLAFEDPETPVEGEVFGAQVATSANETGAEGLDGLAHELWSAAQIQPRNGEGIEDAVRRITAILSRSPDMASGAPADERAAITELLGNISDVLPDSEFDKIDTAKWNAVSAIVGAARAAASPAAEAVAWQYRPIVNGKPYPWIECTKEAAKRLRAGDFRETHEVRDLYDAPQPAQADAPAETREPHTYASTQATNCARCGEHKHTPLRIDWMGGYVCLTCIDRELESRAPADAGEAVGAVLISKPGDSVTGISFMSLNEHGRKTLGKGKHLLYAAPPASRVARLTDDQKASCAVAADLAESNGLSGIAKDLRALLSGADQ